MKYILEFKSFSLEQIKKGIDKSIKNNDLKVVTDVDNIIKNIDSVLYEPYSIENFIYGDNDFISEIIPTKLAKYVQDNKLDIDITELIKLLELRKRYYKLDDNILMLINEVDDEDGEIDNDEEIKKISDEMSEIDAKLDNLNDIVLKIRKEIILKYPA